MKVELMNKTVFEYIYYLGPDGSNVQSAMFKFLDICNIDVRNQISRKTIKTVLESLILDENSLCILPIENSIEGIVRETIDNLLKIKGNSIKIRGEISIPIEHLLLSKSKDISSINKIISHPQALAQCSNFLYKNFKDAQINDVSSTSYAAQKVSSGDDKTIAAIANETCAKLFNLNILSKDINDEKDNKTRFYILSGREIPPSQNGKTGIILSTKNKPGALCEVLQIFNKHKINLTYIDSRPSKKKLGEYVFFIEMDGFIEQEDIKTAINELDEYVDFLKVLGSYSIY